MVVLYGVYCGMRRILDIILFPLVCAALLALPFLFPNLFRSVFATVESVASTIEPGRPGAPLAFVVLQFIQVVVFIIPGEIVQIAGGYLFGVWRGVLYSLVGIGVGTVCNWAVGYFLGARFVRAICGAERFDKFHRWLQNRRAFGLFLVLFLIPGFPKDALTYVGGAARVPPFRFALIALGGRIPALIGSMVIGSSIAADRWTVVVAVSVVAIVLFVLGVVFGDRLITYVQKLRRFVRPATTPDTTTRPAATHGTTTDDTTRPAVKKRRAAKPDTTDTTTPPAVKKRRAAKPDTTTRPDTSDTSAPAPQPPPE